MNVIEITPTCVPDNAESLSNSIEQFRPFAQRVQIDIDDGVFAPHITWPYTAVGSFGEIVLPSIRDFDFEVHCMVARPRDIGLAFGQAGAKRIIGHVETFENAEDAHSVFKVWREEGVKEAGLGVLMQTSVETLDPFVAICDFVHFMSIATIGTQGIPYDSRTPARIAEFRARHPEVVVSVDGGVSEANIAELARAGTTRFGVGSAITKSANPKA